MLSCTFHFHTVSKELVKEPWIRNIPKFSHMNFAEFIQYSESWQILKKWYGYQHYYMSANVYITNGSKRDYISITTSG